MDAWKSYAFATVVVACALTPIIATDAPVSPAGVDCAAGIIELLGNDRQWAAAAAQEGSLGWCDCLVSRAVGSTPLHELAHRAGAGVSTVSPGVVAALVQRFVACGARVLAPDYSNNTALHVAASSGAGAVAVGMCSAAARKQNLLNLLEAEDSLRRTAMIVAVAHGQVGVAQILLQWGASGGGGSTAAQGGWCSSDLVEAVLQGSVAEVLDVIASPGGGNPDCLVLGQDKGLTLLHYAALSAAQLADPRAGADVLQVLLDFGANASRADKADEVPLMAAARTGQDDVALKLLLAAPATISAQSSLGRTALHIAASNGGTALVGVLLDHGAPVDVRDELGFTPLDLAERAGYQSVARMISLAVLDPMGYYAAKRDPNGQRTAVVFNSSATAGDSPPATSTAAPQTESVASAPDPMSILLLVSGVALGLAALLSAGYALCSQRPWQGAKQALVKAVPDIVPANMLDMQPCKAAPALQPGSHVRLHGLSTAALNGQEGTCTKWDEATCRWHVQLFDGDTKAFKPENLKADMHEELRALANQEDLPQTCVLIEHRGELRALQDVSPTPGQVEEPGPVVVIACSSAPAMSGAISTGANC